MKNRSIALIVIALLSVAHPVGASTGEIADAFLSNASDMTRATGELATYMLDAGIEGCFIAPGRAQGTPAMFGPYEEAISGYEVAVTWGHCPPDQGPITVEIRIEYHVGSSRWESEPPHRCTLPVLPHTKLCIYERFVPPGTYEDPHPRVGHCRRARFSIVERPDVPAQYSGIFACHLMKLW